MPRYTFKDGHGLEQQITPEACSRTVPRTYHCIIDSTGELVTLHRDTITTHYTPEELLEIKKKQLESLASASAQL